MSSFTTPADMRFIGSYRFELLAPFEYHIGTYPSSEVICVPAGYITDLTSTPRILWALIPPHGHYAKAAIIHDYLYYYAIGTRLWADQVFLEAMGVLKVPDWRRYIMYGAARVFGRGNY